MCFFTMMCMRCNTDFNQEKANLTFVPYYYAWFLKMGQVITLSLNSERFFFLEFRQQTIGWCNLQDNTQFSCFGHSLPPNCSSLRKIQIEVPDVHCRGRKGLQLLQLKIPQLPFYLILPHLRRGKNLAN